MYEWKAVKLKDVVTIKHGYAYDGKYFSDSGPGPRLVTPGNFARGGGWQEGKPKFYMAPDPEGYRLEPGNLIVTMTDLSKTGDTLGYPAFVPEGGPFLHNQRIGLATVINHSLIDKRFLFYLLCSRSYRNHVLATATGSTVRHTSPSRILDFECNIPPLEVQHSIAEVLGSLDDKIDANRRAVATADQLLRARFAEAVEQGDERKASSVLQPILGGTPARSQTDFWGGSIPWASAKDVAGAEFGVLLRTAECITSVGLESSPAKVVPAGTTIITARGTVGSLARTIEECSFNQTCYALVPIDDLSQIVLYLSVRDAVEHLRTLTHGTIFATITKQTFDAFDLRLPPTKSWPSLTLELESLDRVIASTLSESSALRTLRDVLLPKLLTGELRIRDSETLVGKAI